MQKRLQQIVKTKLTELLLSHSVTKLGQSSHKSEVFPQPARVQKPREEIVVGDLSGKTRC